MATSKEDKDYILEQLDLLDNITCRSMMGEFLLYYNNVLFGGIYDNRLLVKIVDNNKKYNMQEQIPYENAKPMYLVEDVDNKGLLKEIILETCEGLSNKTIPKFYPIVDLHSTWLVLNPIQGCPKKCRYCFLMEKGLNNVKPYILASPEETAEKLLSSNLYIKDIPLCLFSQTDAFSTQSNIEYAKELITLLMEKNIQNPIIFITKCEIPQDFIDFIDAYEKKGHQFVFFLSYSGLKNNMEVGVNAKLIRNNFINLAKSNKKIIHYWRPLIPENSSKETIEEIYNFVKKYAKASIAIGLKITDNIIDNIGWDELNKNRENAIKVNNVWSKEAYDYIWNNIAKREDKYPIFQITACALAYVLGMPDRKAYYNTYECLKNNCCPDMQRKICMENSEKNNNCTKQDIIEQLNKFNYKVGQDQINIDFDKKQISIKDIKLQVFVISFLTEKYKMKVIVEKDENDYYWNSELTNMQILKI